MRKVTKMRRSLYISTSLVCVAALIGLRCGEKGTEPEPPMYGILPDSATVEVSSTQQFAVEFGTEPIQVTWYVDGTPGGSPHTGMITPGGLFIAPPEVPPGGEVTISAEVVSDSTFQESAKAVIESGYGATFIQVNPDSESVSPGDSIGFSPAGSGCALASPEWSVVLVSGDSDEIGTVRTNGTYVAPIWATSDFRVMVMVSSADCPGKIGVSEVLVRPPEPLKVQLDEFTDSHGSGIIKTVPCSGGFAVSGLDEPGEWIEVPYEVEISGPYNAEIHYAAGRKDILTVTVLESLCGSTPTPPEAVFELAHGQGLG